MGRYGMRGVVSREDRVRVNSDGVGSEGGPGVSLMYGDGQ